MTRKSSFRQGRSLNTVGLGWDSLHSLGPHSWALRSNYPRSRKQAVRTQTPSRGLGGVRHPRPGRASFLNPSEQAVFVTVPVHPLAAFSATKNVAS